MAGRMEFDFDLEPQLKEQYRSRPSDPFKILVLGDFGMDGQDGRSIASATTRKADIDSMDGLWKAFRTRLAIEVNGIPFEFEPRELDHFHPDHLYHALPVFAELRALRQRLLDPALADAALAGILSDRPAEPAPEAGPEAGAGEGDSDMFTRLLGQQPGERRPSAARAAQGTLDKLIRELVAPHVVHDPDPRVEAAIESVDLGIAELMRGVLHHPRFQALEAAWRGLYDLVQNVETGEELEISVCDVRKQDLIDALPASAAEFEASALFRLLVASYRLGADQQAPAVMVANYTFAPSLDDVALLGALGACAEFNGAVVLGAACPSVVGCDSLVEHPDFKSWDEAAGHNPLWRELRRGPFAARIGLALPRLLARLPYGRETDPVNSFAFEEMPGPVHEHYLWRNPALALARILGEHFAMDGWNMSPGGALDIGELPAHVRTAGGESGMQPCAEVLLPERSAEAMLGLGIMPVVSFRGRDMARVLRLQSIAEPLAALRGRWG